MFCKFFDSKKQTQQKQDHNKNTMNLSFNNDPATCLPSDHTKLCRFLLTTYKRPGTWSPNIIQFICPRLSIFHRNVHVSLVDSLTMNPGSIDPQKPKIISCLSWCMKAIRMLNIVVGSTYSTYFKDTDVWCYITRSQINNSR